MPFCFSLSRVRLTSSTRLNGPMRTRWNPPRDFEDTQVRGPYAKWVHRHTFTPAGVETLMEDEVRYRLPFGPAGRLAHVVVRRQLQRIFTYREQVIRSLLV